MGGQPKDSKSVLESSGRNGMVQGIVWDSPNEGNFFPGLNVVTGQGKYVGIGKGGVVKYCKVPGNT